ncbi:MAG: hypothetical protein AB7F89_23410 [Pirellulaceae bacterium]
MPEITREDVRRYVNGEALAPERRVAVAEAVDTDPQVAVWYEELLHDDDIELLPAAAAVITDVFRQLDHSCWSTLSTEGATGHSGSIRAVVELPEPPRVEVVIDQHDDALQLSFSPEPRAWTPASVVLFVPATASHVEPVELSRQKKENLRGERAENGPVAAPPVLGGSGLSLAARGAGAEAWKSETVRSASGIEAWLQDSAQGVVARCIVPAELVQHPRAVYRLQWTDPEGAAHERSMTFRLHADRKSPGFLVGEAVLGLRRDLILSAAAWTISLRPCATRDLTVWDADQLREVAGEDLEVLILERDTTSERTRYVARFHSDEQRRLWSDPATCRAIRFQPA